MDKDEKEFLRRALKDKRRREEFNRSLARTISKSLKGKEGYKLYIELMNQVRETAKKHRTSDENAVKLILEGN